MSTETKILAGVGAAVAVLASAFIMMAPSSDKPSVDGDKLVRGDSHQTNKGAKVTLVEFGDLQCPACKAAQPTVEQLKTESGVKLNFVWRHFPLSQHKNARAAANAAEAAGAQGKFFEMVSLMYQNQSLWENLPDPKSVFVGFAGQLGIDGGKIEQAIATRQYEELLNRDVKDGEDSGVSGTPTFFLNGAKVELTELQAKVTEAVNAAKGG